MKKKDEIKVCLVGSSGGHLTHLYMLKPFWKDKNRFWVTFNKEDAKSLLEGEKVYPCYFPTNRSIKALIKNTKIAWNVLHKEKPDLIISCGAAVAVPFFYIGKMMGAKLVYDHQVEFARNVAQRMGTIIPVEDINTLGDIITNYDQIVAGMGHGMSSNNAKFNEELEKLVKELY